MNWQDVLEIPLLALGLGGGLLLLSLGGMRLLRLLVGLSGLALVLLALWLELGHAG